MNNSIGGCSKHIGQSMINCPLCAAEKMENIEAQVPLPLEPNISDLSYDERVELGAKIRDKKSRGEKLTPLEEDFDISERESLDDNPWKKPH